MDKEQVDQLLKIYRSILNCGYRARVGEVTKEGVLIVLWRYVAGSPATKFVHLPKDNHAG